MPPQIQSARILAEATHTGIAQAGTWLWKPSELSVVFDKAKELQIAAVGADAQFRFPDAIYEMYWLSIDPGDRAEGESWEVYVIRSNDRSIALLTSQIETVDLRKEAADAPAIRKRTLDKDIDPLDYLFYEILFNSQAESAELEKWARKTRFYEHLRHSKD